MLNSLSCWPALESNREQHAGWWWYHQLGMLQRCIPHAFIHLIQKYTGMSHLLKLVLLMLCNLLRIRISFQGIPRSAFIANPSSTGICTWKGFDYKSSCRLSSSPRMSTSSWSCSMCAPPLTTCRTLLICSLLRWRVLRLAIWESTRGVVTRTIAKF